MGGGASRCITREGLSDVMKLQEEPLLVTGSFYLIGHLYKMMGLGPNEMVPK
jgi:folylpolyglutamate synthase/dihydropteroate synthase